MKASPKKVARLYAQSLRNISPSKKEIAEIYKLSKEIRSRKYASSHVSKMAKEFTPEVLLAFTTPIKKSGSITKYLKAIWGAFSSAPKLWEKFKQQLGIKSSNVLSLMKELPKKIKQLFKEGEKLLKKAASKMFNSAKDFLQVFSKVSQNLPSVQGWVEGQLPKILPSKVFSAMQSAGAKFNSLADWLDNLISKSSVLKAISWPAKAYLFYKIWINVTELSWNTAEIAKGMLGMISFSEILKSLPESGLGFLFSLLFGSLLPGGDLFLKIGWNALLPFALAIQIFWLYKKGFIVYKGGTISVNYKALGIEPNPTDVGLQLGN